MDELKLTAKQRVLIEKLGVIYERSGMQPVAARVLSLLLTCNHVELTFEDIQKSLKISKSSTSTSLNLLISLNRIEYVTYPGIRKRYFRMKIANWKDEMKVNMKEMTVMNSLFKEVLSQRPKNTKDFNQHLEEIIDFFDFLNEEVPKLFKKWELRNRKG